MHHAIHSKASFSHKLAAQLAGAVHSGAKRAPLFLIIRVAFDAEEQYQALRFFYTCLFKKQNKHEEVRRLGGHNYKPLTDGEKQRIIQMRLAGASLTAIASELNRHVSTIYYFLKRSQK